MSNLRKILTATITALSLVAFSALPASATASLPSGSRLFGLDYNSGPYDQLREINTQTGALTNIGTSRAGNIGPLSGAYNAATGTAYYLLDNSPTGLVSMNISTGVSAVIGSISAGGQNPRSIAISPTGLAYIVATSGTSGASAKLYSLDLSTGLATAISATGLNVNGDPVNLVFNTTTSGLEIFTDRGDLYSVSANGTIAHIAATPTRGFYIGAQIDSTGTIWATDGNASTLVSIARSGAVLTPTTAGPTLDSSQNSVYIQAMFLVPGAQTPTTPTVSQTVSLAETGTDVALIAGVAFLLMGAGWALVRFRRRA